MKPNDQSDMIERYLLNRMTEEENAHFEKLIQEDPSLFEEVKLQKELFELANDEDFRTIYPKLKAQDEAYHKGKQGFRIFNKKFLRIILVLFILLMVLYFIKQCANGG